VRAAVDERMQRVEDSQTDRLTIIGDDRSRKAVAPWLSLERSRQTKPGLCSAIRLTGSSATTNSPIAGESSGAHCWAMLACAKCRIRSGVTAWFPPHLVVPES
jgi:hypothetical protein